MGKFTIQPVIDWLRRVVTQPHDELTRWQMTIRFARDLSRYGAKQLRRDQAPWMAAALSFRTLFGLLPVFVVGTLLVKALGGFEEMLNSLRRFFDSLGWGNIHISGNNDEAQTLSVWLLDLLRGAETLNLSAVGWIGVAVLIYAAISLMVTIEGCFNRVCRAPSGRTWMRRFPLYWTTICLAPAAVALTAYADRSFQSFITEAVALGWFLEFVLLAWSLIVIWLVMFTMYKLLPNTNVHTRPALIGSFVAAVLLELGRNTMSAYIANALTIKFLYGSLGLIPLFMLWVYIMWLVILFGLQVTATLQMLAGRSLEEIEPKQLPTGLIEPGTIISLMEIIMERFSSGMTTDQSVLMKETGLPPGTIQLIIDRLIEDGILHRVEGDEQAMSLSRPPEKIQTRELIDIGFALVDESGDRNTSVFRQRLREVQRQFVDNSTLAGLGVDESLAGNAR